MSNTLIRIDTNSQTYFYAELTKRLEASGYQSILLTHREVQKVMPYPDSNFTFKFTLSTDIVEDSKRLALVRELVEKEPNTFVFVEGLTVHNLIEDYPLVEYIRLIRRIPCDVFVFEFLLDTDKKNTDKGYCINYDKYIRHQENRYATLLPRSPVRSEHNVEDPDFGVMSLEEWTKAYVRNKKINEII
jgi:hypothetical protein